MIEYCTEYNITRKDKEGNLVPSLGSGILAYLKSQLLGDIPPDRVSSHLPTPGLTRTEVLDLIAESNNSNVQTDETLSHRLEIVERSLSSASGVTRAEIEQLIQASRLEILETLSQRLGDLQRELMDAKPLEERVDRTPRSRNVQRAESRSPQRQQENERVVSADATAGDKPISKDVSRWLKRLQEDEKFRSIVQTGIDEEWSNQVIVSKLFAAGYGKNDNAEAYPANLGSAMKTALEIIVGIK